MSQVGRVINVPHLLSILDFVTCLLRRVTFFWKPMRLKITYLEINSVTRSNEY